MTVQPPVPAAAPASVTIRADSPFPFDGDAYLKSVHAKFTTRAQADGARRYELTRDSLKKGTVLSLESRQDAGGSRVDLTVKPAFDPESFCRQGFVLPAPEEWVRIRCAARFEPR